jgi:hypothetical protein
MRITQTTRSTIIAALLTMSVVALIPSCISPLDSDAPRTETPVTPAVKITPRTINVDFTAASGSYRIKGLPTFRIDTTVAPMRFWIDCTMETVPDPQKIPMLKEFRVRVDSFPGNGLSYNLVKGEVGFSADFGNGVQVYPSEANTNTAAIIIAEQPRQPGQTRSVTLTLYLVLNKDRYFVGARQEQTLGTIVLTL